MRIRTVIFFAVLMPAFVQAGANCSDPQARYQDIACASALLANADKSLNETYASLAAKLDQDGKDKLKLAQRAWVQNREDEKVFLYANSSEGGSLRALLAVNNELDTTIAREKQLRELLNEK